jgi:hypothetical protein
MGTHGVVGISRNSLYIRTGLRYSQGLIRFMFGFSKRPAIGEMAISKGWKGNNVIQGRNKAKKRVRPVGHRSVEVGFGLYFQQK